MKKAGQQSKEFTLISAFAKAPCSRITAGITLFVCLTLNAFAFDRNEVAVSAEVTAGKQDGSTEDTVGTFYGSLTLPVWSRFNVHLESAIENAEDELAGLGLHAYWQHPGYGLLGLTISGTTAELKPVDEFTEQINVKGKTTGLEVEAYIGPATLALQGGRVFSNLEELDDENYSAAELYLPVGENFYVHGGTRTFAESTANSFEAGYSFASAISLYAGGAWDEYDYQYLGVEYLHAADSNSNLVFTVEVDKGEEDFEAIYFIAYFGFGAVENAPLIPLFGPISGGFR